MKCEYLLKTHLNYNFNIIVIFSSLGTAFPYFKLSFPYIIE